MRFREAGVEDCESLWLWRNDPAAREASRNRAPIRWQEHVRWFKSVLADPDRHLWIAQGDDGPIGMVRFDAANDDPATYEISINLRPEARGSGMGKAILTAACAEFAERFGSGRILAAVHARNTPSRHIFEGCGFASVGAPDAQGFITFALDVVQTQAAQRVGK